MKNHHFIFSTLLLLIVFNGVTVHSAAIGEQPLSQIAVEKATIALSGSASIRASPDVLGIKVRLLQTNLVF